MILKDGLLIGLVLVTLVVDIIMKFQKKIDSRWDKLLWLPVIGSVVHLICSSKNIFMYPVYIASIILCASYLFRKKKILYIGMCVLTILGAIFPIVVINLTGSKCYISLNYVEAFKAFHQDMKEEYALRGWKETDFNEKYDTYIGLFEEAEEKQDKLAYVNALRVYMSSYQDGHVQLGDLYETFGLGSTRNIQNANRKLISNYYGMSLLKLDQGDYVAVNVVKEGSADQVGIKEGTIITKWNGESIDEQALKQENLIPINCSMFADVENKERFQPFYVACNGGEQVEVTFMDEKNTEQTVKLTSMGNGYEYLYKTIGKFLQKDIANQSEEDMIYETKANHIGYLQIKGMGSEYNAIKAQIQQYIEQIKTDEIKCLIIDVRNNHGGDDEAGVIIASQFAKEDMCYLKETTYDSLTSQYQENRTLWVEAENQIDIPIIMLVNSQCISAGEGFVYNMAKLDHVIVAGVTGTNGSFGTIDGVDAMPEGLLAIYPSIACVDENGTVMIDSRKDGIGGIKPELKIPVDKEAAKSLFAEGEDYELDYVMKYISNTMV